MSELKGLRTRYEPWKALNAAVEDLETLYELATEAGDEGESAGIEGGLKDIVARYEKQNLFEMMGGELDGSGCFLTVHSGAGGNKGKNTCFPKSTLDQCPRIIRQNSSAAQSRLLM